MNQLPMLATALTSLRKLCFTLLCCTVLMVVSAAAQNNEGPPTGAILDLANPPQAVPGAYQQYSVEFTATVANTAITFAFREDPAFISFSNASVTDVTNPGLNLLINGDFSAGPVGSNTPVGWTYANQYGASAGGVVDSSCGEGGSANCWYDGAVQAYDAISQTIATNVGDTYLISFWVTDNSGCECNFSDLSTNGDNTGTGGNGINVTVYAQQGLPAAAANTLTVMEAGQGTGNVSDGTEGGINCTDTNGTVTGTCSASYPNPTSVTLTATWDPTSTTTFGGWGGACAGAGMNATCTFTVSGSQNVSAVFNAPGPTQGGQVNPGQPNPTVYSYGGGFSQDNPNGGYDFTGQETSQPGNQGAEANVTAIPLLNQQACNTIVDASFPGADCFVYQNGGGQGVDAPVMFAVTCPDSESGTCGSSQNADFYALLGSDFNFSCSENSPLQCGPSPAPFSFGFPNLTSADGLPTIGFLKGVGPDPNNPCTPYPGNNPPLFLSNQIVSFNLVDPGSRPVVANSGGTGSCWVVTYLTSGELPTVSITAPMPNGTYTQGQATQANYTCNAVTTVTQNNPNPATGPYLTVASCTAADSPGGAVGQGAQFDTSTVGPHKFTAYVQDSATNTNSSTVSYTVNAPAGTTSANYTSFMQGTPGSFTITTTGYPAPSLSISPAGSLPSGLTFVNNGNGTATISGTPTTSGLFSFWVIATNGVCTLNGVCTPSLQSFSLTVNPAVTVSPASISYGNVVVGQSVKNYVTVTNKSNSAIGIGPATFTVTSGNKSQFSIGQACPATLQPGTSCSIGVVFAPVAAGTGAATLNIPTSVSSTPQSVSLSGTGINPQASFSPTSLPFGTVKVAKSSTLGVTLTNTGTSALAISSVTISGTNAGNFTKSNACPSSLAAGAKCTISVTFTPSVTGARSANLTVTDNALSGSQVIPLSGTGN
jgi:Abnormal spindle-like microcephaly-assoc'd, ASPM-SPD-2-Hydin/Divergent InlB B-repeat domain